MPSYLEFWKKIGNISERKSLTDNFDFPYSYAGKSKYLLRVKETEDGVEFFKIGTDTKFIDLIDVSPNTYSGMSGKGLLVNDSETGLKFTSEKLGVDIIVVSKRTDLPLPTSSNDISDGRLTVTKDEYHNLYVFDKSINKWKLISGINRYLNQLSFPNNTSNFLVEDGSRVFDITNRSWRIFKDGIWQVNDLGSLQFETFTYESQAPRFEYKIKHNLDSLFLIWNILVEDPKTETWGNDDVNVRIVDSNNIIIKLTEESNIKMSVIKIEPKEYANLYDPYSIVIEDASGDNNVILTTDNKTVVVDLIIDNKINF